MENRVEANIETKEKIKLSSPSGLVKETRSEINELEKKTDLFNYFNINSFSIILNN